MQSPVVDRLQLGGLLASARRAAGVSREDAAKRLRRSPALVSRIEHGDVGIEPGHVQQLGQLYGLDKDAISKMIIIAIRTQQPGWWVPYKPPKHLIRYLGLETVATSVLTYEQTYIPALLQTDRYSRAIQQGSSPDVETSVTIERAAGLRQMRQSRLDTKDPLVVDAVIADTVFAWGVGGTEVRREQARHLLALGTRPNIAIRVLRASSGAHPAMSGPYSLLKFGETPHLDTAYLEHHRGTYLDERDQVVRYDRIHQLLRGRALGVAETRAWLTTLAQRDDVRDDVSDGR